VPIYEDWLDLLKWLPIGVRSVATTVPEQQNISHHKESAGVDVPSRAPRNTEVQRPNKMRVLSEVEKTFTGAVLSGPGSTGGGMTSSEPLMAL
jgi:hypothetical protein